MSYIRSTSVYKYVDAENPGDYIYPTYDEDKNGKRIHYIVDYGKISNETLVELLFRYANIVDNLSPKTDLKNYLLKKVAERLGVKLRKKPLTSNEEINIFWNNHKIWLKSKEWKKFEKMMKK